MSDTVTYSPTKAGRRILAVLKPDVWLGRKEIAILIGREQLNPNEIVALERMAKQDLIDRQTLYEGASLTYKYKAKS